MVPYPSWTPLFPQDPKIISVNRKPTHTDQYLQHLTSQIQCVQYSITQGKCGLHQSIWTWEEQYHIRQALLRCKYPLWALNRPDQNQPQVQFQPGHVTDSKHPTTSTKQNIIFLAVPYTRGLNETFIKVCNKIGTKVHF